MGGFFICNALVAELIGVKIFALEDSLGIDHFDFQLFGVKGALQFSAGVLLWPVVFVMTDIINEYFGLRGVRTLSFLAAGLILFAFFIIFIAIWLEPADWWVTNNVSRGVDDTQAAFTVIFGQGGFIIIGSLTAFLVGQLVDVFVFQQIKKYTGEKRVWLRATGSTLISQLVDSFVVLIIAFRIGPQLSGSLTTDPWGWDRLLAVCTVQYVYKFVMAIVLTPAIYGAHSLIDRYLGKDLAKKLKRQASES